MADRKTAQPRRKERKEAAVEAPKDKKEGAMQVEAGAPDGGQPLGNGDVEAGAANGEAVEPMELPPFEIITGYVPTHHHRSHTTSTLRRVDLRADHHGI